MGVNARALKKAEQLPIDIRMELVGVMWDAGALGHGHSPVVLREKRSLKG